MNSLKGIEQLQTVASKHTVKISTGPDEALIQQSISYLSSSEATDSLASDAYWPKWSSPWWQMLLLYEMGLESQIPQSIVEKMVEALDQHYAKSFPFTEEEVPAGLDPLRHIACHCQLGTMHQLLANYGINVESRLFWFRSWYLQYQMKDGGLNCDEAAYTRAVPKSSVVSTLPPLEAVLNCTARDFTVPEIAFLDQGANYLIQKRLFRTASTGQVIDPTWLKLCFPRFYHYDVLRGLSFLLNWARKLNRPLPLSAISECVEYIDNEFPDGLIRVQRAAWNGCTSRWLEPTTSSWTRGPATSYPLLDAVSTVGTESIYLTKIWSAAKKNLLLLIERGLINTDH